MIEIVIVTAMVSGALFAFSQAGAFALKLLRHEKETLEMTLLAQEGLEVARSLRDDSWAALAWRVGVQNPSLPYYPVLAGGRWTLSTTSPGLVNNTYSRFVIFEKVRREGSDRIASSGSEDQGTLKVISRATTTARAVELAAYLTDFQQYIPRPTEAISVSYEGATNDGDLINFPANDSGTGDPGQSFTTPASAIQVTKVSLFLRRATVAPSNVYLELRTAPDAVPALGTSTTVVSTAIAQAGPAWVDFIFPWPVPLAAATSYTMRLRSIPDSAVPFSGSAGALRWQYLQSGAQGPYSGGAARRYLLSTGQGQVLDQYDFGFRVYAMQ